MKYSRLQDLLRREAGTLAQDLKDEKYFNEVKKKKKSDEIIKWVFLGVVVFILLALIF